MKYEVQLIEFEESMQYEDCMREMINDGWKVAGTNIYFRPEQNSYHGALFYSAICYCATLVKPIKKPSIINLITNAVMGNNIHQHNIVCGGDVVAGDSTKHRRKQNDA